MQLATTLINISDKCGDVVAAEKKLRNAVDDRMRDIQSALFEAADLLFNARSELEEKSANLIR